MAVTTLICAFASLCGVDGTCDDRGLTARMVHEDGARIGEMSFGKDPFPVETVAPDPATARHMGLLRGGGGLFPPVLTTHWAMVTGEAWSGRATCASVEGREL